MNNQIVGFEALQTAVHVALDEEVCGLNEGREVAYEYFERKAGISLVAVGCREGGVRDR